MKYKCFFCCHCLADLAWLFITCVFLATPLCQLPARLAHAPDLVRWNIIFLNHPFRLKTESLSSSIMINRSPFRKQQHWIMCCTHAPFTIIERKKKRRLQTGENSAKKTSNKMYGWKNPVTENGAVTRSDKRGHKVSVWSFWVIHTSRQCNQTALIWRKFQICA